MILEKDCLSQLATFLHWSIIADENNLDGTLPSELSTLAGLVSLDFDSNTRLSGTLPEEFGDLRLLTSLDIDNSTFSGTLPESLYQLTNLESLDINLNQFTGGISSSIGNLVNLNVLQIDSNGFGGPVPSEIGQLENLSELNIPSLADPFDMRSVFSSLFLSISIGFFTAADTQLTGEILPFFEGRTNLQVLGVGENEFVGSIPEFFGDFTSLGT